MEAEKAFGSLIVDGNSTINGYSGPYNGNVFYSPIFDVLVTEHHDYSKFPKQEGVKCYLLKNGQIVATNRDIGYLVKWGWVHSPAICEVDVIDISNKDFILFTRKSN